LLVFVCKKGGGILDDSDGLIVQDSTFIGNVANSGITIYCICMFDGCFLLGGAICIFMCPINVSLTRNVSFYNNFAYDIGAAIQLDSNYINDCHFCRLQKNYCTFYNNTVLYRSEKGLDGNSGYFVIFSMFCVVYFDIL